MAAATVATTVPAVENVESEQPSVVKFEVIFDKLHFMQNLIKEIQSQLKTASKSINKAIKKETSNAKKKGRRQSATAEGAAPRAPSGFAKPTKLSPALCKFLGVTPDTLMARTEVTRKINQYIKSNNLQDTKDKRNINPDAHLKTLLNAGDTAELTYFNLQSRIKHHFVKAEVAAA
jgi:chromatin remodeling complex protein RSC6